MKPLGALGRGACPAPSAPSSLCFLLKESQDFKECTQLSVACGRKIEKRFKRSEIKEVAPPVTHKTCLIDFLAAPVILTGKNSGLLIGLYTPEVTQRTVFAVHTAEQTASTGQVPQLARAQSSI